MTEKKTSSPNYEAVEELYRFRYLKRLAFANPDLEEQLVRQGWENFSSGSIDELQVQLGSRLGKAIDEDYLFPHLSVRLIDAEVGYGLFADQNLKKGDYLGEYVGVVRKNDEHGVMNHYLYSYPLKDEIGRNFVIDASSGNLTRFINHSDSPNLKPHYLFRKGRFHVAFIAILDIKKSEQLTYHYGPTYWYVRKQPKPI